MPRWLLLPIMAIFGIALGLLFGWVIDPVKFVDTTPASLRADYRADYVLMVAEAYSAEHNSDQAAQRLAIFGSEAPSSICAQALQSAQRAGFSSNDLSLLQDLARAMQAYQPIATPAGGTP